jgi:hypothetical protein
MAEELTIPAEPRSVDLSDPAYRIHAQAFNAVGRALRPDQFLLFGTRQRIADAVRQAIADEIRANPQVGVWDALHVADLIAPAEVQP